MNKITFMIVAIVLVCQLSLAQEAETTTYFGEKCGFKIDFPTDWAVTLTETKVMMGYNTIVSAIKGDAPGAIVQLRLTFPCKSAESDMKSFKGIFEKDAKKSKDANFKIHDQGEGKTAGGKEFYFLEYSYTLVGDDGASTIMHRKFYTTCHRYKGTTYSYSFFFQTYEPDWGKFSATYENIFKSVQYTEKEK